MTRKEERCYPRDSTSSGLGRSLCLKCQLLTRLLFQDLQGLFKEDRYTTSSFNLHLHPYTALS